MGATINSQDERSFLGKAWDAAKGVGSTTLKSGLLLGAVIYPVWQGIEASMYVDGARNITYYAWEDAKMDTRSLLTGGWLPGGDTAEQVRICQPKHHDTHGNEIAPPPHLATLYDQMEQNLVRQIETRDGHLFADIHIDLNHGKHPLVIFYKTNAGEKHDYDYKVLGMPSAERQDCDELTPNQSENIVKRERGTIAVSHFGF